MTQAGTSLTQHYEVNDISGGGPYTLTLDRNLVAWSDSGTVIGVITDYCHDSILDGQGAIVTGPCNRWVSIFGGHRIRVCNWRGTNDAAEPSEQFAFDVASLDSVICDIAIVAPDNTRGCIAEADENCMFIRVNGNTCFGFNGGHGNKVLDCRIDVPANNAAVAIDTLHDVGMLGFEIRGMRAYGGQNGVYWNATHGARAYENHGVVDSEFVGQAGVGILSTVPISQLNLTGVTCKCLPSDTAWHGFQIDDTAAGSSVNWSNCSVNTAEDTTGTFAADVRGLLAGVGSVYHVDGFHSRNMTIGIYNKGTMCASRLDIDEVGVTAAFGGACFATGVASHSTISQSKLKSGANQYCIIQFEDQSVVSIDHTACLLGFSGWGNGAGVGSLRIGDDCDVSTTTLGNGTPGGGIMRPSRGTVQLNQATPVNVAFPDIRAIDVPRLTLLTRAGTYGGAPNVIVTPGTGFSVTGQALDTSTYSYSI
jgi:hypothetical protein